MPEPTAQIPEAVDRPSVWFDLREQVSSLCTDVLSHKRAASSALDRVRRGELLALLGAEEADPKPRPRDLHVLLDTWEATVEGASQPTPKAIRRDLPAVRSLLTLLHVAALDSRESSAADSLGSLLKIDPVPANMATIGSGASPPERLRKWRQCVLALLGDCALFQPSDGSSGRAHAALRATSLPVSLFEARRFLRAAWGEELSPVAMVRVPVVFVNMSLDKGVVGWLELKVWSGGHGEVYRAADSALVSLATDFRDGIDAACSFANDRFDAREVNISFSINAEGIDSGLEGPSAGAAYGFGLVSALARAPGHAKAKNGYDAERLLKADPSRVVLSAALDRTGGLHNVGGLGPKLIAVQNELYPKYGVKLLVAAGAQDDIGDWNPPDVALRKAARLDP